MDSKFGPNTIHEEVRQPEEHNGHEEPTIMVFFSQMRGPPVLTPVPDLFPQLDMCTIPKDAGGDANEIVESLSQLSLAAHVNTQQLSPIHATPSCSR